MRSVGNSIVLRETFLIEAFNLKAAVEYMMDSPESARRALSDMPPRDEEVRLSLSYGVFMLCHASSAIVFIVQPVLQRACAAPHNLSNPQELDPVTLHNSALMNVDTNAQNSFRKLNYLLQNPPCLSFRRLCLLAKCMHRARTKQEE